MKRLIFSLCCAVGMMGAIPASAAQKDIVAREATASPSADPPEVAMLNSKQANERRKATEWLFAYPDAVEPFNWIYGIRNLWEQGDRQQAAFWYYIWQSRCSPWVQTSSPDTYGALYASISSEFGPIINEWIASDPDAFANLAERSMSYEKKIALYKGHPADVSDQQWNELVSQARARMSFEEFKKSMPSPDEFRKTRKQNGLYVGPWQSPGKPLPDNWR